MGPGGFGSLMQLVKAGKVYIKVTHRFMQCGTAPRHDDCRSLARLLLEANASQILWGTDWPHTDSDAYAGRKSTDVSPFLDIDDGLWLNRFANWVGDEALLKKILVENPARLYGF